MQLYLPALYHNYNSIAETEGSHNQLFCKMQILYGKYFPWEKIEWLSFGKLFLKECTKCLLYFKVLSKISMNTGPFVKDQHTHTHTHIHTHTEEERDASKKCNRSLIYHGRSKTSSSIVANTSFILASDLTFDIHSCSFHH